MAIRRERQTSLVAQGRTLGIISRTVQRAFVDVIFASCLAIVGCPCCSSITATARSTASCTLTAAAADAVAASAAMVMAVAVASAAVDAVVSAGVL